MNSRINVDRLIEELRIVAEKHFNEEPLYKAGGICTAIHKLKGHPHKDGSCYFTLRGLGMIVHGNRYGDYLCPLGTHWDERAMFALILAEYLEQGGEV